MKYQAYTVWDSKGEVFNVPFFQRSEGEAVRSFVRLVGDPNSMVGNFKEDFDLYHVGEYDDQKGIVECNDSPRHVIKASAPEVIKLLVMLKTDPVATLQQAQQAIKNAVLPNRAQRRKSKKKSRH